MKKSYCNYIYKLEENDTRRLSRITQMEHYFDVLTTAFQMDPLRIQEDAELHEMLLQLIRYYESGLWRSDYECDERGELPSDLKRGVLSEDAIYNFLADLQQDGIL